MKLLQLRAREDGVKREFSPPLQQLTWVDENAPYSELFSDRFYSRDGGLAETRWVFLSGNNLPERWHNSERFVIGELGFGTGLNFLATWQAWKQSTPESARLEYISFEQFPLCANDIRRALMPWPELEPFREKLLEHLPLRLNGFHRLHFENVSLTLIYGDARLLLPELCAEVDAWYLDGFSPARNVELWGAELFAELAKKSAGEATVATYSVARAVVDGLKQAGFSVEKMPGFGSKNEMLVGRRQTTVQRTIPRPPSRSVIVIGGGLAGTAVCRSFSQRKWQVTLLERNHAVAQCASGNPAGILMPHLSVEPDYLTRVSLFAYDYVLRELRELQQHGLLPSWKQCGVLRLATSRRLENLTSSLPRLGIDLEIAESLSVQEIEQQLGVKVSTAGIFFSTAGWLSPPELCQANLAACSPIKQQFMASVAQLRRAQGHWQAVDMSGEVLGEADVVVVCNGYDVQAFPIANWLPLEKVRGQVLTMSTQSSLKQLQFVLCYDGYVTPAENGVHMLGATFNHGDDSEVPNEAQNIELLNRLRSIFPDFYPGDSTVASTRVGFRTMSRDRLPVVGELPDFDNFEAEYRRNRLQSLPHLGRLSGLYVNTGFGSRGILWSHFCAELLAAHASGDPLPIEHELVEALDPARFPARLIRQGVKPTASELDRLKVTYSRDVASE